MEESTTLFGTGETSSSPSSKATQPDMGPVPLLERIEAIDTEIDAHEAKIKQLKSLRRSVESLAIETMQDLRLERGIPAAGRKWTVSEELRLSVPKDRQTAVMEAAEALGIEDTVRGVNTSGLKAWLIENAKSAGRDTGAAFSHGTPFAGLVSEYSEFVLRSRKEQ
jgi:hypothetical protein